MYDKRYKDANMTFKELILLLRNSTFVEEIDQQRDEILKLIPKVGIMVGFDQQNYAHQYELWEHCLRTVIGLPKSIDDNMVFFAALIHDIGKPDCQTIGEKDGKISMHYYGHHAKSMEITRDEIIPYLISIGESLSEDEQRRLLYYVGYHDDRVSLKIKHLRRHMNLGVSLKEFQNLMKLQVSDAKAHVRIPIVEQRIEICEKLSGELSEQMYNEIK